MILTAYLVDHADVRLSGQQRVVLDGNNMVDADRCGGGPVWLVVEKDGLPMWREMITNRHGPVNLSKGDGITFNWPPEFGGS